MKLKEAQEKILRICNIPFSELFDESDFPMIKLNKGKTGQLLEMALGKRLDNCNLDFEDGELKTNKCDANGTPLETVFITQIASVIDELLDKRRFEETHLFEKINNILYVPVCKEGDPHDWMFLGAVHIDLKNPIFAPLLDIWRNDYYSICDQLIYQVENDPKGQIHTVNGKHIQIRTKDSIPYHKIYSKKYNQVISDKNRAFYFKRDFVFDLIDLINK